MPARAILLLLAILLRAADPPVPESEPRLFSVLSEFGRLARRPLWPGFEPQKIVLEVEDSGRTWLLGHPEPPAEFVPIAGHPDVRVFEGRHESARANSAVELAGVPVAIASFQGRSDVPASLAALLLHEAFHVFQSQRHPKWGGNEVDLLLYPTAGQEALALRRLESEALRRAVAAAQTRQARAWAAGALELRRRRFSRLPASAAAYERGTELKEGLARYIEVEAIGFASPLFPPTEFSAAAIRARGYASGCAMALLLDRLHPTWKGELEEKDDVPLDALLARAVAGTRPRDLPTEQEKRVRRRAAADVAHLRTRRPVLRREFLEAPGWTVVVESNQPLSPTGFDPLNVEPLSDAEVLHTRWLKLAGDAGSLEVLDRPCLTEAAGAHPLFQGVRRVTITGVTEEPRIEETQDAVKLSAKGLQLRFRRARLTRLGRTLTITVEDESNPSLQSAPE